MPEYQTSLQGLEIPNTSIDALQLLNPQESLTAKKSLEKELRFLQMGNLIGSGMGSPLVSIIWIETDFNEGQSTSVHETANHGFPNFNRALRIFKGVGKYFTHLVNVYIFSNAKIPLYETARIHSLRCHRFGSLVALVYRRSAYPELKS